MELPVKYSECTPQQRRLVREEYVRIQDNKCSHCKEPLSGPPAKEVKALAVNRRLFPDNFFKWPVHLHHSHDTGLTLGAVHSYCNAVLWQYHGE